MDIIDKSIRLKKIKEVASDLVSSYFNLDINKETRQRAYIDARSYYCKLLRDEANFTFYEIANSFTPTRNHATIIHSINRLNGFMEHNTAMKMDYTILNSLFSDQIDGLLLDKYGEEGMRDQMPRYRELVSDFQELKGKYKRLKKIHNDLVLTSEKLSSRYSKLEKIHNEREQYYRNNGFVIL